MNWSNKSLAFLGLNEAETKILNSFDSAKNHLAVSKEISIPRTTVAFITKNLVKKGFILPIKHGKRFLYVSLSEEQLADRLKQTLGGMRSTANERKGAQIRISKESQFTIHVGIKEVIEAYSRIASANKNTRIKALQSSKSWNTIVEKLAPNELIKFNQSIIENGLIVDGILQEDAYVKYGDYLKSHPEAINAEAAKSLTGRMADYTIVPPQFFDVYSEIWIFRNTVIIINWREEVAIEITNQEMMGFLRDMFEFVKMGGKKVNHEEEMRKILENIKEKAPEVV